MKTEVTTITPQMASDLLARNKRNRTLRPRLINRYAEDMKNGDWALNGEPIQIADSGMLLNGQHRLEACVQSDAAFTTVLVTDLPETAQDTMDTGAVRTHGNMLSLHDVHDANLIAAITRQLVVWEHGYLARRQGPQLSHSQTLRYYNDNIARLHDASRVARLASSLKFPMAPSQMGFLYVICADKSHAAAEKFFVEQLIEGVGLERGAPALALRQKLANIAPKLRYAMEVDITGFALVAWNHFRRGETVTTLRVPHSGWNRKTLRPR